MYVCVPFVIVHAVFALSTMYSALELVWKFQRLKDVGVTLRYIVMLLMLDVVLRFVDVHCNSARDQFRLDDSRVKPWFHVKIKLL